MSDAINNAMDMLRRDVATQTRDPEEARRLMIEHLGEMVKESGKIPWEVDLKKSTGTLSDLISKINEMKQGLAELEAQLYQAIEQPISGEPQPIHETTEPPVSDKAKKPIQAIRERKRPSYLDDMLANLPPGTLPISEFAEKHGITYRALRHYIENGIAGDHIEITAIPFEVKGRPNYKIKLLTPKQQDQAVEFLKKHRKYGIENNPAPSVKPTGTNLPYAGGRDRELPPGCILYTEFASKIGIPISTLRDYITRGIPGSDGTKIEAETRPKPSKPSDTQHYLTVRQQLTAIELLDRYHKLRMSSSEASRLREALESRANSQAEVLS
jgi:hypothetical protein